MSRSNSGVKFFDPIRGEAAASVIEAATSQAQLRATRIAIPGRECQGTANLRSGLECLRHCMSSAQSLQGDVSPQALRNLNIKPAIHPCPFSRPKSSPKPGAMEFNHE